MLLDARSPITTFKDKFCGHDIYTKREEFFNSPSTVNRQLETAVLRCMLRSKIHMATVTDSNITYEGSLTVDETILKAAGIKPYEQVMVSNLNNGERFETYIISGKKNSGVICLNGPTAR
ncbi:MAG: aspartate 1-decarboxylase, partial [Thermodesulfovibrionia bacterium]